MKSKVLITILGAVFVVCAGVFGYAAWRVTRRPRAGGGLAGRVSRDVVALASFDLRQVRAWQPALDARDFLTRQRPNATAAQRDAASQYAEFQRNCGFDPWQKVDAVHLAAERSALAGNDASAIVGIADGTFTQPDADRCIRWIVQQSRRIVAPSTVRGHTVLTAVRQGEQPASRDSQFALLGNSVMVTEQRYTDRALSVIDRAAPALADDAPLLQWQRRLGPTTFLGAVADLAALRAQQARSADEAVDDLVRAHPAAPDLALLKQARMGGVGAAVVANNLAVNLRVEVPTAANAQSLTGACTTVVNGRRSEAQQALREAKQAQAIMRITLGAAGGMAERFAAIDQGFDAAEQVLNQLACRAEGSDAILGVTVTPTQITAFQNAFRAFVEVMEEAQRANPLGGLLGGGRNDPRMEIPSLGGPILDRGPAPRGPSLGGPNGLELAPPAAP